MYGFQPKHARGKPAQALADGGLVQSITGMLGMRKRTPEEMLAADAKVQERNREAAARVAARAKPAQQAALAEEKAVSSYAGMSAMQRREKELGLKDGGIVGGFKPGGLIRGPGTGTSDSIETEKRPGTFIMPADSTQAIGPEALQSLGAPKGMPEAEGMEEPGDMDDRDEPEGEKVPVRLSNGEFELPPEQVQALGEAVLTVLRDATHERIEEGRQASPKAAGFAPSQFFADGGVVTDEERRARLGQGLTPYAPNYGPAGLNPQARINAQASAPAPAPISPQAQADRAAVASAWNTAKGASEDAGRAIADVATLVPRGLVGAYDSAVVRPMRAAGMNAAYLSPSLVPDGVDPASMTPFTDQKRMREAAAPAPNAGAGAGRGSVNPPAVVPSAPAAQTSLAGDAYMPGADANARPMFDTPAAPASNQVMPGVYQHGRGQYSDNPAGMGFAPGAGNPSANNIAAADALASRSAADVAGLVAAQDARGFQPQQAPQVRHSGNDWQARNDLRNLEVSASSITNQHGFSRGGRGYVPPDVAAYQAALQTDAALQQAQPGMDQTAMRENAGITREGMQQAGATTRTGMQEQGSNAREAGRNALAQGEFGLKKEAAGFQTRALQRLESLQNRYEAEKDPAKRGDLARQIREIQGKEQPSEWGIQVTPATKNADGSTTEGSVIRYNKATGQAERVDTGAPAPIAAPKAGEVRNGYRFKGGNPNDQANWTKV